MLMDDQLVSLGGLLLAAFFFAVSATCTPGPNNILLLSSGANYGVRRTIPHGLGIVIGMPLFVSFIGLGLGQVFTRFPVLFPIIKVLGIGYLCFLAWKIMSAGSTPGVKAGKGPMSVLEAVMFQWINPKSWVMGAGAISAFTQLGQAIYVQVAMIALAFLLAAIISCSLWIGCGAAIRQILNNAGQRRVFNLVMGILLIASILPMIPTI